MVIAHNMLAMNADRQHGIVNGRLAKSTAKLSSGYRINRASDDAAGLAISEKMRYQIRGLNQASDNAADGISLIQTAEGALGEVHSILQRMSELSVKAANDTNMSIDRDAVQAEMDNLKEEIDRIIDTTEFNNMILLDGTWKKDTSGTTVSPYASVTSANERVSSDGTEEAITYTIEELSQFEGINIVYEALTSGVSTTQSEVGDATISGYDSLKTTLETQIVPQAVQSIISTYDATFGYLNGASIGIGLRLYSDSNSGVLAYVRGSVGGTLQNTTQSYQLGVNMASLSFNSDGSLTDRSRQALEATISHEMIHAFMDETLTNGMFGFEGVVQSANAEFPGWFTEGMAQTAAGGYNNFNDFVNGSYRSDGKGGLGISMSSSASDISDILKRSPLKLTSGTPASEYGTGYLACMYLGYLAGGGNLSQNAIAEGLDQIMNEVKNGYSLDSVIAKYTSGKYSGIDDFASSFGDADSSAFVYNLTQAVGNGSGTLTGSSLTATDVLADNTLTGVNLFKLNTTNDFVENAYPTGYTALSGAGTYTGATASGTGSGSGTGGTGSGGTTGGTGGTGSGGTTGGTGGTTGGTGGTGSGGTTGGTGGTGSGGTTGGAGGTGSGGNTGGTGGTTSGGGSGTGRASRIPNGGLNLQVGKDQGHSLKMFIEAMDTNSLGIDTVDVSSFEKAGETLTKVQDAINKVSEQRSELASYQNRLEHTIINLDNEAENTTAAESRIRDVDMADEMVRYSKEKILMQATQSVMAQLNKIPESVLSLLG